MAATGIATGALNDKTNMTNQASLSQVFDNSGWAVNIGSGTQNASSAKATPVAAAVQGMTGLLQNPLVLAVIALAIYSMIKNR